MLGRGAGETFPEGQASPWQLLFLCAPSWRPQLVPVALVPGVEGDVILGVGAKERDRRLLGQEVGRPQLCSPVGPPGPWAAQATAQEVFPTPACVVP